MAISYTISYTFSPGTTISSSQVNTNFSDNANTWTGLEALTKSFSNLRVDATPTAATDVAIKSYVDKLNSYRRPVLQYSSTTVVNIETGINGTSGQAQILFPDGTVRTDSTSSRINLTMSQTAAFSGTAQSGIDTGSVSNNTWYAVYAAKVTDSSTNFVTTASLLFPIQANVATLNSRLGTNGWVYLGLIPYGNNSNSASSVLKFYMAGNTTYLQQLCTGNANGSLNGIRLATSASAATITWTYAAGTAIASAQVPNNMTFGYFQTADAAGQTVTTLSDSAGAVNWISYQGAAGFLICYIETMKPVSNGLRLSKTSADACDIQLVGWIDGALGIGANPIL